MSALLLPLVFTGAIAATQLLLATALPPSFVSPVVVGAVVAAAAILERVRPGRPEHRPLDRPLAEEARHFVLGYNLGYALALAGCAAVRAGLDLAGARALWPSDWPLVLQLALAVLLAEGVSYWQHRAAHRVPWLWRFHALHHRGERLNVVRAGRFHAVDIGTGAFLVFVPLAVLQAPELVLVWTGSLVGVLGIVQHANVAMPTPAWLDRVVCTPAVHRSHHAHDRRERDANFGTTTMLFDLIFGTYVAPLGDDQGRGRTDTPSTMRSPG